MRGDQEFGTLPGLWASAAERFGDAEALVDAPVRFTFRQLHGAVREAARAFVALGVQPGDRVAIWAPNTWEWVVALGGLHTAGAVLVPLNTRFKGPEAAYILAKSGAKVLLTVSDFLGTDYVEMLDAERQHLPALERVVVIRGRASASALGWSDFVGHGQSVAEEDVDARVAAVAADDISDIDRFLAALQHADQDAVREQLARDPGLLDRLTPEQRAAALTRAAEAGHAAALALMLDLGIPVNARDGENDGATALHAAAYHGSAGAVRLLLARGADLEARDATYDSPPLDWAMVGSGERPRANPDADWIATVQALLDAGASTAEITLSPDDPKPPSPEVAALLRAVIAR